MTDTPDIEVPAFLAAATVRKCGNCMWWTIPDAGEFRGLRECRGSAPTTSPEWNDEEGPAPNYWPRTRASNWCGSFRMKEPGQ